MIIRIIIEIITIKKIAICSIIFIASTYYSMSSFVHRLFVWFYSRYSWLRPSYSSGLRRVVIKVNANAFCRTMFQAHKNCWFHCSGFYQWQHHVCWLWVFDACVCSMRVCVCTLDLLAKLIITVYIYASQRIRKYWINWIVRLCCRAVVAVSCGKPTSILFAYKLVILSTSLSNRFVQFLDEFTPEIQIHFFCNLMLQNWTLNNLGMVGRGRRRGG